MGLFPRIGGQVSFPSGVPVKTQNKVPKQTHPCIFGACCFDVRTVTFCQLVGPLNHVCRGAEKDTSSPKTTHPRAFCQPSASFPSARTLRQLLQLSAKLHRARRDRELREPQSPPLDLARQLAQAPSGSGKSPRAVFPLWVPCKYP